MIENVIQNAIKTLDDDQISFLLKEINISKESLFDMAEDELRNVFDRMCDIEIDETCNATDEISERGETAAGIVTVISNAIQKSEEEEGVEDD